MLPNSCFAATAVSTLLRPWLRYLARSAAPKYRGEITLAGLDQEVSVRWQSGGIPHVLAATEGDLFFAQGYLHAQERLWQMDLNRRFLSGRVAEILGRFPVPWKELTSRFRGCDSVDVDYFMRLIGIRRSALAAAGGINDEDRRRLQSYSAGVNRFIEQCGKRLPLEFRLLRYQPDPWKPEDTFTIAKGFAFLLSLALFTRLNAIAVAAKLAAEPEKFHDLYPLNGSGLAISRAVWDATAKLRHFVSGMQAMDGFPAAGHGSNAWVIGPARSDSGNAILCNDPHLRMTLPSVWYLMHLRASPAPSETNPYEVWGATLPGCPCVQAGHNRWIAWGLTAALCDDVEIYREKIHRLEPDRYNIAGRWELMKRHSETIRIKGAGSVEKTIRWTRHGPVLSDFDQPAEKSEALSLRWTAHETSEDFQALYRLNRARDWDEFLNALSHHSAPPLNFLYADQRGNIGFSLAGKVPLRSATPSMLPVEGWDSANEWPGFVPFDDLPRLFNPPQGAIASANNNIVAGDYPYYLSRFFEPPYRVQRINELLAAQKVHSFDDMSAAQADVVSLHSRELIATLSAELRFIQRSGDALSVAAGRLLHWDGYCGAHSISAAIFHVFHHRLIRNLLVPTLGEESFIAYVEIFNQSIAPIEKLLRRVDSSWFDGRSLQELVRSALAGACAELAESLGPDQDRWQWGSLHAFTLRHPFSRLSFLRPLFSAGPFPSGGDNFTINLGLYRHSNPYEPIVGPSLRMVVETGENPRSRFSLPSGQSGHPFSPHFRDQTMPWQRQEYIELSASQEKMADWPVLLLKPPA